MGRNKQHEHSFSRRRFLRGMRWAPALFLPAPLYGAPFPSLMRPAGEGAVPFFPFADFRIAPHYPAKSPMDDVLRQVVPGLDEFVTEKYAFEIARLLNEWSKAVLGGSPGLTTLAKLVENALEATSLVRAEERTLRSGYGIEVSRRRFATDVVSGRERFLQQMKTYLAGFSRMETAEFEIVGIEEMASSPVTVRVDIRYDFVGAPASGGREERVGHWLTRWMRNESGAWRAVKWQASEETVSRASEPIFVDVTSQSVGRAQSCRNQMRHGLCHWRPVR